MWVSRSIAVRNDTFYGKQQDTMWVGTLESGSATICQKVRDHFSEEWAPLGRDHRTDTDSSILLPQVIHRGLKSPLGTHTASSCDLLRDLHILVVSGCANLAAYREDLNRGIPLHNQPPLISHQDD